MPPLRPVRRGEEGFLRRDPRFDLRPRRLPQLRPLLRQGGEIPPDREPVQYLVLLSEAVRRQSRAVDRQLHGHDLSLPRAAGGGRRPPARGGGGETVRGAPLRRTP